MLHPHQQMPIIQKGASLLVDERELYQKLMASYEENRPLTVKLGLDPSAPDIHIGHAVVLRKIRQLQDLGHRAIIVIGDFTGKIGDPTGKSKGRVALTDEQVIENAKTYCEQIFKIVNEEKTEVRFNSEWLAKLTLEDVVKLAASTTVARIMERDEIKGRFEAGVPIGIHEMLYPLMQAYDSVALEADIELGGTDQTFNVLMGRTVQKHYEKPQQVAIFMPILEGLDGVEKMSKSQGNYIGVSEPAEVMFKKVMEVPDELILKYFNLATDLHPDDIRCVERFLKDGGNPRDMKYILAKTITALYHSEGELQKAMEFYDKAFAKKDIPEEMPEIILEREAMLLSEILPLLVREKNVASRSEFLRLLKQGGVRINGKRLSTEDLSIDLRNNDVLKIGKKQFLRFVTN